MILEVYDLFKTIVALLGSSGLVIGVLCVAHQVLLGFLPPRMPIIFAWFMLASYFYWDACMHWLESGGDQDADN